MEGRLLKKFIKERGMTVKFLAKKSGMLWIMLRLKLWGMAEFTLGEMERLVQVLGLTEAEASQIFFSKKFPKGNK